MSIDDTAVREYALNRVRVSENFWLTEYACKGWKGIDHPVCGCGRSVKIDALCRDMAQGARTELGKPLHISSAFRCPVHNENISGSPTSSHLNARALDFSTIGTGLTVRQLADLLIKHGAVRVGLYMSGMFVHAEPYDKYVDGMRLPREFIRV